jgi:hypothetical protein
MADKQIPYHPVLGELKPGSVRSGAVTKLSGYVGPASAPQRTRLYASLEDLSHYLEFDTKAVVQTTDTPANELPYNAQTLWLKAGTGIHWIREYTSANHLVASVASSLVTPSTSSTPSTPTT